MKTKIGKISLWSVVVSAAPWCSLAATPSLSNGMARDLNRLTLLTGPNLTSPARLPVQASPLLAAPAPEMGAFRFVPDAPPPNAAVKSGPGVLTLRPASDNEKSPAPASSKALPKPESLRFDSTLHAPAVPPRVEFKPAPKPD